MNHLEKQLQYIDSATYIGVTFDIRKSCKPHISNAETNVRRILILLKKLAGTHGVRLKRNYRMCIMNNTSTPRLWINNMLIIVEDIEVYTRQIIESSIKTNYWVNEINSNYNHGRHHCDPTVKQKKGYEKHVTG